jgi:hypothetical protein
VQLEFYPIPALALILAFPFSLPSQVKGPIDEAQRHTLLGNTRPQATPENDRGRVPDNLAMEHMLLQLQRTPAGEQQLQQFVDSLHDPKSKNFHKWLSSSEFGQAFGLAQEDLDTISGWLRSHGFTVNSVYPNGLVIDFSGTAGQVNNAFHTEIHYLQVNGEQHIANMTDPQIPLALAPVVAGGRLHARFQASRHAPPAPGSDREFGGDNERAPGGGRHGHHLQPESAVQ